MQDERLPSREPLETPFLLFRLTADWPRLCHCDEEEGEEEEEGGGAGSVLLLDHASGSC